MTDSLKETLARLENVEIMYFMNQDIYTEKKGALIQLFEEKEKLTVAEHVPPLQNKAVSKIIIAHKNQTMLAAIEQQIKNENHSLCMTFSEPEYLEILPNNTSKGNALKYLVKHHIGSERQIVTFGNNLNDISLISQADIGIAVNNAHPELKRVSTIVLQKTNLENAIADYIEKRQLTKEMA